MPKDYFQIPLEQSLQFPPRLHDGQPLHISFRPIVRQISFYVTATSRAKRRLKPTKPYGVFSLVTQPGLPGTKRKGTSSEYPFVPSRPDPFAFRERPAVRGVIR